MPYHLYILLCNDGTYYTGSTNDLQKRLRAHNHLKSGAKYTRMRRPVKLLYSEEYATFSEAKRREVRIKTLTRKDKEHLISSVQKD